MRTGASDTTQHTTFGGFPARPECTVIPNVFFSDVLPRLQSDTLPVALYAFRALARKRGFPRFITAADLAAEPGFDDALKAASETTSSAGTAAAVVTRGLEDCVDAGMLLPVSVEPDGAASRLYFLNAPADRRGLEAVRSRSVDLGPAVDVQAARAPQSIYALYESLVGGLSPLIANELSEAERLYPADWLEAAFREAAAQNARSWRYISRILERWAIEGPDHAKTERDPAAPERYFRGKYGGILKRRIDTGG
jgi:DnaD/phage-associated family protein